MKKIWPSFKNEIIYRFIIDFLCRFITAPSFSNDFGRTLIFGMMQDHLFDMKNDGQRFGMMFISGLPSPFGMKGDDRHFGRGMIIILKWNLDLY